MKKKIAYISLMAAFTMSAFLLGKNTVEPVNKVIAIPENYINVYDITGWDTWEEDGDMCLLIDDYIISKKPYTLVTTVTKE